MNAFAIIAIILAAGFAGLMIYGGRAMLESARRPRHEHKWKVLCKTDVVDHGVSESIPVAMVFTLQCEGCGDIQAKRVSS